VRAAVPSVHLFGPPLGSPSRLANTLNLGFAGVDGKVLVTRLDLEGLAVGAGSACASGSLEPSHVLIAMGFERDVARSALRVSCGWNTTDAECKRAVDILAKVFSGHTQRAVGAAACAQPGKSSLKSR
jgi:cysteine desulfurase